MQCPRFLYMDTHIDPSQQIISQGFENIQKWFGCLASGLAFIHSKRIRHKDIKPANILVWNYTRISASPI